MVADFQEELLRALEGLREQDETLGRVRAEVDRVSVTATSPDRGLTVTVNGRGDLVSVRFANTRFRTMPPAQLGQLIVETVAEAKREAATRVGDLLAPMMPAGLDLTDTLAGRIDPVEMFRESLAAIGLQEYLDVPADRRRA